MYCRRERVDGERGHAGEHPAESGSSEIERERARESRVPDSGPEGTLGNVELCAACAVRCGGESLKTVPAAVKAGRVLIAYSRRAPEEARSMMISS